MTVDGDQVLGHDSDTPKMQIIAGPTLASYETTVELTAGRSVALADTIAGCKAILAGEYDTWQESSLYMIGTLDEGRQREAAAAQQTAAQQAAPAGKESTA